MIRAPVKLKNIFTRRTQGKPEPSIETFSEPSFLFVYGTLMRGLRNNPFLESTAGVQFVRTGEIAGTLYNVSNFPGVKRNDGHAEKVQGEIYQIDMPDTIFETLDIVEGYNKAVPERSLFIRECVSCPGHGTNGEVLVWVYLYNHPVDKLEKITSGNYRHYISPPSS